MFAHSSLSSEMTDWLHSAIIKAFLRAGCERHAHAFMAAVQWPMLTAEDVQLHLTVLLANG